MKKMINMFKKVINWNSKQWKIYVSAGKGVRFYTTTSASSRMNAKSKIEKSLPDNYKVIYIWEVI